MKKGDHLCFAPVAVSRFRRTRSFAPVAEASSRWATYQNKRALVRPVNGRKVGGVCAAIANHLNVDVTLVRVVAVLAILIPPFPMLLVYVICWFVIPSEDAYPVPAATPGSVPGAARAIYKPVEVSPGLKLAHFDIKVSFSNSRKSVGVPVSAGNVPKCIGITVFTRSNRAAAAASHGPMV